MAENVLSIMAALMGDNPRDAEDYKAALLAEADAAWVLAWNNPKLHPPERRKTWTACDEHRESLSEYLSVRGFLRRVDPLQP